MRAARDQGGQADGGARGCVDRITCAAERARARHRAARHIQRAHGLVEGPHAEGATRDAQCAYAGQFVAGAQHQGACGQRSAACIGVAACQRQAPSA